MNIVKDGLTPVAEIGVFLVVVSGVILLLCLILNRRLDGVVVEYSLISFVASVLFIVLLLIPYGTDSLYRYTLSGKITSKAVIEETGKTYVRFTPDHDPVVVNNDLGFDLVGRSVRLECEKTHHYNCDIMIRY